MRIAVYPGSFNPIHPGHLEIIRQATKLFDKVVVLVATNPSKHYDVSQGCRKSLITQLLKDTSWLTDEELKDKVDVEFTKLSLVDYCYEKKISIVIKGIRDANDLRSELDQREYCNVLLKEKEGLLLSEINYVFLNAGNNYSHFSSSSIRQFISICSLEDLKSLYFRGTNLVDSSHFGPYNNKNIINRIFTLYNGKDDKKYWHEMNESFNKLGDKNAEI